MIFNKTKNVVCVAAKATANFFVVCFNAFLNFCKSIAMALVGFYNAHKADMKKYIIAAFSVFMAITLIAVCLSIGVTVAYDVVYNGKKIATVRSIKDYNKAINLSQSMVVCNSISDYTHTPEFLLTFTVLEKLTKTEDLAKTIIAETDAIVLTDSVYINGEHIGSYVEEDEVDTFIETQLNQYNPEEGEVKTEFQTPVEVKKEYYPKAVCKDKQVLCDIISNIPVKTTVVLRKRFDINYPIQSKKSDTYFVGEVVRVVNGEAGIEETVTHSVYVNGKLVSSEIVEKTVIKEPIAEVTIIGTLPRQLDPETSSQVNSLGLIFPLLRINGPSQVVTSWWGDGRGHKGIDIASPSGTPIYAAQSGTVITSCYIASYGNYIIIDHGNGWKTCYAHASKLYAKVGDYVSQGQVIAAVGTTGQSTGNHLHFEVRKNNVKIDPAPFLGYY